MLIHKTRMIMIYFIKGIMCCHGNKADNSADFRVLLGRSHIKAVAENRRTEIERFLQELMSGSAEVAHVS